LQSLAGDAKDFYAAMTPMQGCHETRAVDIARCLTDHQHDFFGQLRLTPLLGNIKAGG
jgi:hypothetical protein